MQENTPTLFIGLVPALCMLAGLAVFAAYLATGRRLNAWLRLPVILLAAGVPVILLVLFWPGKIGDRSVQSYLLLTLTLITVLSCFIASVVVTEGHAAPSLLDHRSSDFEWLTRHAAAAVALPLIAWIVFEQTGQLSPDGYFCGVMRFGRYRCPVQNFLLLLMLGSPNVLVLWMVEVLNGLGFVSGASIVLWLINRREE